MHNTLVVVYSNTGTGLLLAHRMCAEHGWAMGEIKEPETRTGLRGMLRCVMDSCLRRQPPIRYEGPDPETFDAVVLVSPIWAYRLAGPMRSFVASEASRLRHYAVVSVMGGSGAAGAAAEIDSLTGRSPVLSVAFTAREVEDGSFATRLPGIVSAVDGVALPGAARPTELSPQAA
jgi:hypothetical protein